MYMDLARYDFQVERKNSSSRTEVIEEYASETAKEEKEVWATVDSTSWGDFQDGEKLKEFSGLYGRV